MAHLSTPSAGLRIGTSEFRFGIATQQVPWQSSTLGRLRAELSMPTMSRDLSTLTYTALVRWLPSVIFLRPAPEDRAPRPRA